MSLDELRKRQYREVLDVWNDVSRRVQERQFQQVKQFDEAVLPKKTRDLEAEASAYRVIQVINKLVENKVVALENLVTVASSIDDDDSDSFTKSEFRKLFTTLTLNQDFITQWNTFVKIYKTPAVSKQSTELIKVKLEELKPNMDSINFGLQELLNFFFEQGGYTSNELFSLIQTYAIFREAKRQIDVSNYEILSLDTVERSFKEIVAEQSEERRELLDELLKRSLVKGDAIGDILLRNYPKIDDLLSNVRRQARADAGDEDEDEEEYDEDDEDGDDEDGDDEDGDDEDGDEKEEVEEEDEEEVEEEDEEDKEDEDVDEQTKLNNLNTRIDEVRKERDRFKKTYEDSYNETLKGLALKKYEKKQKELQQLKKEREIIRKKITDMEQEEIQKLRSKSAKPPRRTRSLDSRTKKRWTDILNESDIQSNISQKGGIDSIGSKELARLLKTKNVDMVEKYRQDIKRIWNDLIGEIEEEEDERGKKKGKGKESFLSQLSNKPLRGKGEDRISLQKLDFNPDLIVQSLPHYRRRLPFGFNDDRNEFFN